jgi:hypothetical protein
MQSTPPRCEGSNGDILSSSLMNARGTTQSMHSRYCDVFSSRRCISRARHDPSCCKTTKRLLVGDKTTAEVRRARGIAAACCKNIPRARQNEGCSMAARSPLHLAWWMSPGCPWRRSLEGPVMSTLHAIRSISFRDNHSTSLAIQMASSSYCGTRSSMV